MAQISENSFRSSSRSISFGRLSGDSSAMNSLYSSTVGSRPVMSIVTRRKKTSSLHSSLGSTRMLLQLGVDQLVDVIGRRRRRGRVLKTRGQHQHLAADGVGGEAGHDEGLAAGAGGHQSVGIDRSRVVVVREKHGQVRHVAVGAVGVLGPGDELLRGPSPSSTTFGG